jgi:4-hydroxy-tetrahydrodipicolinate reductase
MPSRPARIAIVGACGRLGSRIDALARGREDVRIVASIGREDPDPEGGIDVVIEAAGPSGVGRGIDLCERLGASLVSASTGLAVHEQQRRQALAERVAVLEAPNLSPGIALLRAALAAVLGRLPEGWTIDIHETHHAGKLDRPSGTALMLAVLADEAGHPVAEARIHSERAGGIIGEHELVLSGPGESLRFRHEALSRDVFAAGAIDAAIRLVGRPAGRYTMADLFTGG